MYEKLVRRVLYVAQCDCNLEEPFRDIKEDNPPREVMCPNCKKWIEYKEESWTGQDSFNPTQNQIQ